MLESFPMSVFIFLATACLGLFLPQIIRDKGVSSQGIGLLWTVFPFVSLITASFAGGLADQFKIHKLMFLTCLFLLMIGNACVYFSPPLKMSDGETHLSDSLVQWQFWLLCFSVLTQYVGLNAGIVFENAACFNLLGNIIMIKGIYFIGSTCDSILQEIKLKPTVAK